MQTNNLYMVASVNNDKQCNYVTPFHYSAIETEYNTSLGKVNTPEDINTVKQAFLKINNTANGTITQCCNPELDETNVTTELLTQYRTKFPAVRDIIKNGVLDAIEVSTVAQNMSMNGWKLLSPYYLCKLSKSELKATSVPNVFRTATLLNDCYSKACSADTVTLAHLFNSTRVDTSYTYYDDAKVAQSIQEGDAAGLEKYLRKYNKVNVYLTHDDYENTLLHLAARNKSSPKILAMLLAVKPNLEVRNADGDKPLHVACRYGNMPVVEQLVKLGAEVNPKNNKGETPVMLAVGYDNAKYRDVNGIMLRYLYNNGANLFDQDNKGNTILHHIIKHTPDTPEKTKLVRFVIDHGVSAETKNTSGLTALELTADLLDKLVPTTTKAPGATHAAARSHYFAEPVIPYKTNTPFPIKKVNYDTLGKTKQTPIENNSKFTKSSTKTTSAQTKTTNTAPTTTTTKYMAGSNAYSSDMQRFQKWLSGTSPTATVASLIANSSLTKAATTTTQAQVTTTQEAATTTTQAAQTFKDIEGFQVDKQDYENMTPREKELLQIQTLLFNDILKSNPDKYNKYINVSEVPRGAPVEVLDYMCTGGNDSVTGTEDRETCEAMGGQLIKIKNPTTLVKLELLPESERMIEAEEEDELYYPKYPESMPERPLPTLDDENKSMIPTTTQKVLQKASNKKSSSTPTLKTNEMFTDFSDTYISRDAEIAQPFDANELASGGNFVDNLQIYNQVPAFANNGNNLSKPNMVTVDLEHPKIPNGQYLVQETVKAGINSERISAEEGGQLVKKVKVLSSNVPLFITLILLFIILGMVMYIWLKK